MKLSLQSKRLSTAYIVKLVLSIAATLYLLFTIKFDGQYLRGLFNSNGEQLLPPLILVGIIALMPLNWFVEALKWRKLQQHANPLTVRQSAEGVLMGIPVTWFTPNGIGSFLGRMWGVSEEQRELAVASTIIGNLAQLLTTLILGLLGGLYVITKQELLLGAKYVPILSVLVILGLGWFLSNLSMVLPRLMNRFQYFRNRPHIITAIQGIERKTLLIALAFSFTRYIIFSIQLWLLLVYLGRLNSASLLSVAMIPVYYLLKAGWPTITLGEVGAKGVILQSLFGASILAPSVVIIPLVLWLINTIIPGVLGLILLYKARVA